MPIKRSFDQAFLQVSEYAAKRFCVEMPIDLEAIPGEPLDFECFSYSSQDLLWSFDPIDLNITREELEEEEETRAGAELLYFLNHSLC